MMNSAQRIIEIELVLVATKIHVYLTNGMFAHVHTVVAQFISLIIIGKC